MQQDEQPRAILQAQRYNALYSARLDKMSFFERYHHYQEVRKIVARAQDLIQGMPDPQTGLPKTDSPRTLNPVLAFVYSCLCSLVWAVTYPMVRRWEHSRAEVLI